jgi:hypothetical protein
MQASNVEENFPSRLQPQVLQSHCHEVFAAWETPVEGSVQLPPVAVCARVVVEAMRVVWASCPQAERMIPTNR